MKGHPRIRKKVYGPPLNLEQSTFIIITCLTSEYIILSFSILLH